VTSLLNAFVTMPVSARIDEFLTARLDAGPLGPQVGSAQRGIAAGRVDVEGSSLLSLALARVQRQNSDALYGIVLVPRRMSSVAAWRTSVAGSQNCVRLRDLRHRSGYGTLEQTYPT
jgi:hypothetical protein